MDLCVCVDVCACVCGYVCGCLWMSVFVDMCVHFLKCVVRFQYRCACDVTLMWECCGKKVKLVRIEKNIKL